MQLQGPTLLGQRIQARRLAKNMTVADLARASLIGAQEIRAIERNPWRGTNIRALISLAKCLECSTDWLLGIDTWTDGTFLADDCSVKEEHGAAHTPA